MALFKKLDCLLLKVTDIESGLKFYSEKLGHEVLWKTSTAAGLKLPETDAELVISVANGPETDITVENVEDSFKTLVEAGAKPLVEPFEVVGLLSKHKVLTEQLVFEPVTSDEAEKLAEWLSSDTWPFFLGRSPTKEEALTRIKDGEFFGEGNLTFWVKLNAENIGLIELYQLDDLSPMFSVRFKSNYRGRGFGYPTVHFLTDYIFKNFPEKNRVEAQTREDNIPMRKVFNKVGYVKEAYFRKASPTENGEWVASISYGMLKEDWTSGQKTAAMFGRDHFFAGDLF